MARRGSRGNRKSKSGASNGSAPSGLKPKSKLAPPSDEEASASGTYTDDDAGMEMSGEEDLDSDYESDEGLKRFTDNHCCVLRTAFAEKLGERGKTEVRGKTEERGRTKDGK